MAKKKTIAKSKKPAPKPADVEPPPAALSKFVKFKVEEMHRSLLKGAPYNPRTLGDEEKSRLRDNLERMGLLEPLVWNKRSGNLVSGHQRIKLIDALEGTDNYTLPIAVVDLNDKEEKEQCIFFNNSYAQGDYDLDKLGAMLQDGGVAIENTGFTAAQVYQFFGDNPLVQQPEQLEVLAAQMREARERYNKIKEACGRRDDMDYYLVVFASVDERSAFLERVGLPDNRFVNGSELAKRLPAAVVAGEPAPTAAAG